MDWKIILLGVVVVCAFFYFGVGTMIGDAFLPKDGRYVITQVTVMKPPLEGTKMMTASTTFGGECATTNPLSLIPGVDLFMDYGTVQVNYHPSAFNTVSSNPQTYIVPIGNSQVLTFRTCLESGTWTGDAILKDQNGAVSTFAIPYFVVPVTA